MPSELKLGKASEASPLFRYAIHANMPIAITLLSSNAQLLQLQHQSPSNDMLVAISGNKQYAGTMLGTTCRIDISQTVSVALF